MSSYQEIERKFLVKAHFKPFAIEKQAISQGFLSTDPERTVRIRTAGQRGFITVKGPGNATGTTRFEWEKEIPLSEASQLLNLCQASLIEKVRYRIPATETLFFEVDEFLGVNQGLVLAEIELPDEQTPFPIPHWLGEEVTGNPAYYNAVLSQHPFQNW